MHKNNRLIFVDAVTLSNFALAGRFDLIVSRYGKRAVVTVEVLGEIYDGIATGRQKLRVVADSVLKNKLGCGQLSGRERVIYGELLNSLAPGEASCIACAQVQKGVVATDDKAARVCCKECGIALTGTIGILLACCRDKSITPGLADEVLSKIIHEGFYSPIHRITDLLP